MSITPVRSPSGEIVGYLAIKRDITERKAAEAAARFLASIVECSNDAIYSVTPQGMVLSWNESAKALFGYTAAEIVGKLATVLVPLDRREEARRAVLAAREGTASQYETVRIGKSGQPIDVAITVAAIKDSGGCVTGLAIVMREIGERVRAAQKLRESEELFRRAFENAPFGMSLGSKDGHILQANEAFCRVLGYSEREIVELGWQALIHPDDLEDSMAGSKLLVDNPPIILEMEKRYLHRSGRTVWAHTRISQVLDSAGAPLYAVAHIEDVTERNGFQKHQRASHPEEPPYRGDGAGVAESWGRHPGLRGYSRTRSSRNE